MDSFQVGSVSALKRKRVAADSDQGQVNGFDWPDKLQEGSGKRQCTPVVLADQQALAVSQEVGRKLKGTAGDSKFRGSYRCSKCGQPKKGHNCPQEASVNAELKPRFTMPLPHAAPLDRSAQLPSTQVASPHVTPRAQAGAEVSSWPSLATREAGIRPSMRSSGQRATDPSATICKLDANDRLLQRLRPSSPSSSCSSSERLGRVQTVVPEEEEELCSEDEEESDFGLENSEADHCQGLPEAWLARMLSLLPPDSLLAAGAVCQDWYRCSLKVWAAVREASLVVRGASDCNMSVDGAEELEDGSSSKHIGHILERSPNLTRLKLTVTSSIDDEMLHVVARCKPQLASLELVSAPGVALNLSGQGISLLLETCHLLEELKVHDCSSIPSMVLKGPCLTTLWLGQCHRLQFLALDCPRLSELSLDFSSPQGLPDLDVLTGPARGAACTAAVTLLRHATSRCKNLQRLHVSSPLLNDTTVMAVLSNGLRRLKALSLTRGRGITNESAAQIVSRCMDLELLDLSGSQIMDSALEVIANTFSSSLRHLLVALCPNLTPAGVENAASRLPYLELLDCGFSLKNSSKQYPVRNLKRNQPIKQEPGTATRGPSAPPNSLGLSVEPQLKVGEGIRGPSRGAGGVKNWRLKLQNQMLRKLSLWGCSNLQGLELDCPLLKEVNLTGCTGLRPGDIQLACPVLKDIHGKDCTSAVLASIHRQMELVQLFQQGFPPLRVDHKRAQAPVQVKVEDPEVGRRRTALECRIHLRS